MAYFKKMFNGEMIFHKKDTDKVVLLHYKWKTWYQVQGKKNFVFNPIMHQTSFFGAQNIVQENNFVAIL